MKRRDFDELSTFPLSHICRQKQGDDVGMYQRYDHSIEQILLGENPFDVWGHFCGLTVEDRALLLDLDVRQYEDFIDCFDYRILKGADVRRFCLYTQIHPADLVNPKDAFIPAPIFEMLLVVANHSTSLEVDRSRAIDVILQEAKRYAELPEDKRSAFSVTDDLYGRWLECLRCSLSSEAIRRDDGAFDDLGALYINSIVEPWVTSNSLKRLEFSRDYFNEQAGVCSQKIINLRSDKRKASDVFGKLVMSIARGSIFEDKEAADHALCVSSAYISYALEKEPLLIKDYERNVSIRTIFNDLESEENLITLALYDNIISTQDYNVMGLEDSELSYVRDSVYFYSDDSPEIQEFMMQEGVRVESLYDDAPIFEEHPSYNEDDGVVYLPELKF